MIPPHKRFTMHLLISTENQSLILKISFNHVNCLKMNGIHFPSCCLCKTPKTAIRNPISTSVLEMKPFKQTLVGVYYNR